MITFREMTYPTSLLIPLFFAFYGCEIGYSADPQSQDQDSPRNGTYHIFKPIDAPLPVIFTWNNTSLLELMGEQYENVGIGKATSRQPINRRTPRLIIDVRGRGQTNGASADDSDSTPDFRSTGKRSSKAKNRRKVILRDEKRKSPSGISQAINSNKSKAVTDDTLPVITVTSPANQKRYDASGDDLGLRSGNRQATQNENFGGVASGNK